MIKIKGERKQDYLAHLFSSGRNVGLYFRLSMASFNSFDDSGQKSHYKINYKGREYLP